VFCLGVFDQGFAFSWINAAYDGIRREWASLTVFVPTLETRLPVGAMVFQMPSSIFLTETGRPSVLQYDHIKPYLVSRHVHWSYPALSDRVVRWQQQVSRLPPAAVPTALLREGFTAVLIDRTGYADRGAALLASWGVRGEARAAVLVENDRYVALDLHRLPQAAIPPGWLPRFGAAPVPATTSVPTCAATTAYAIGWIGDESAPFPVQPVRVRSSGVTRVEGWAVDTRLGRVAGDVDVVVGERVVPTLYGGDRSDVADTLRRGAYRQSGFAVNLNGRDLSAGAHPLSIRILAADRSCYYQSAVIPVFVQ